MTTLSAQAKPHHLDYSTVSAKGRGCVLIGTSRHGLNKKFCFDILQAYRHNRMATQKQNLPAQDASEKITVYISSDQINALDELIIKLRKRQVRTNRSELVRTAIDSFIGQELEMLVNDMTKR